MGLTLDSRGTPHHAVHAILFRFCTGCWRISRAAEGSSTRSIVRVAAPGMAAMREVGSKLVDVAAAAVVQSAPLLRDAVLLVRGLARTLFPLWFSNVFEAICCYGPARVRPRSCHCCTDPLQWGRCECEGAGAGLVFDSAADGSKFGGRAGAAALGSVLGRTSGRRK